MPVADKLQALLKHRRAWQKLDWTSKTAIDRVSLGGDKPREHELVARIFAFEKNGPEIFSLAIQDLDQNPRPSLTHHTFSLDPGTYVTLTMDPTQDLLAIIYPSGTGSESLNLVLRSLSTNQPHPMARRPTILIDTDDEEEFATIQIADDVVGVSFGEPGVIRVLNWRTGVLLANVTELDAYQPAFQFLSPRAFVTASLSDSGMMDIFMITPAQAPDRDGVVHVARLRFPELAHSDGVLLWMRHRVSIYSSPVCGHPIQGSFSPGNDTRIYLFLCRLQSQEQETAHVRLMVHHRTLAEYVSRYVLEGRTECIDLEWEDWGPENTRILEGNRFDWLANAHGEHVAILGARSRQLQVLDFGVIPGDPANDPSEDDTLVFGPSTVLEPFNDPITTYLPFRRTLLDTGDYFNTILMDHEHIIVAQDNVHDFFWAPPARYLFVRMIQMSAMTVFKF
ncbi:hypothetical protein FB45DRAFT_1064573 [Roridomyces roridus]|uniref:Uncharacterized protein n=1 Tax=Roridomyces roridus TaxID=1738132 RepID=A0AAD7B9U0_9AGAR|nr:hypothetical protein FB45DRAFT_1064573 [Roridomyces roridus]